MALSQHYSTLSRATKLLRVQFLPASFSPTGVYADHTLVQAHARAYLVLCHAEVETYLETWSKDIAKRAENLWVGKGKICLPLAHLLSNSVSQLDVSLRNTGNPQDVPTARMKVYVSSVLTSFYRSIKENHGVKEESCFRLLATLGVDPLMFGATLLPALESFGKDRGEHAHHSAGAIVTPLDPETEFKRVEAIVSDLKTLDGHLSGLRKGIR